MGHGKNFDEKTVVAPGAKWNKAIATFGIAGIDLHRYRLLN